MEEKRERVREGGGRGERGREIEGKQRRYDNIKCTNAYITSLIA